MLVLEVPMILPVLMIHWGGHRIQQIVVLMTMIYHNKNIQNANNKGERHFEQSPEETRCKPRGVLSQKSRMGHT